MYMSLDFACKRCREIEERFIQKHHRHIQSCDYCGELMIPLPPATATTFKEADKSATKKARK